MRSHGVFTIGQDAPRDAVKAAVMCEDVARTVHLARELGAPEPLAAGPGRRAAPRYQNITASADRAGGSLPADIRFRRGFSMTDRKPRIGILGIMQDLYDDMIPGIAQRQAGYAAEIAAHLADVGEFIPGKPVKYREDAEREMREFENAGLDGVLVVMLTYGPGHAGRPAAVARRGCRSAWPTSSRSPTSRPRGTWPT